MQKVELQLQGQQEWSGAPSGIWVLLLIASKVCSQVPKGSFPGQVRVSHAKLRPCLHVSDAPVCHEVVLNTIHHPLSASSIFSAKVDFIRVLHNNSVSPCQAQSNSTPASVHKRTKGIYWAPKEAQFTKKTCSKLAVAKPLHG